MTAPQALLQVSNLQTYFFTEAGVVRAVDGLSFSIGQGEALGIVGESGSGKSVASLSVLNLIPSPPGRIVGGRILLEGRDLAALGGREMRRVRGKEIAMIFQEPMTSLNPVYTIGNQLAEAIRIHQGELGRREITRRAVELMNRVRLPDAAQLLKRYPHELSGGMRQRVMIAMALSCRPKLLICDEPTTALDVTVQAQILALINSIRQELDMAVIFITHDLSVIQEMVDRVIVMYAGAVMEEAPVTALFQKPLHPYTQALFKSIPSIDRQEEELYTIKGTVPSPYNLPNGCLFSPRCEQARDICLKGRPDLMKIDGRLVRCILYNGEGERDG